MVKKIPGSMKHVFFLLLMSNVSFAQSIKPPDGANLVLVTFDTMSVPTAFKAVGRTLIDMGFTINKADKEFQLIETELKNIKGGLAIFGTLVIIQASVKHNQQDKAEVRLSGFCKTASGRPIMEIREISYRGMKGSIYRVAFEKLQAIASQLTKLSSSTISYALQ